ncbi:MAG: AAA family ATPase [Anaerolineaceae bacterium]|nr:AAA family ATPase [Anaerolineaceae bacterium]
MKISRIKIQNFRSIKNLEFYPSDICALVGENGSGKTNILAALDFLLGEKYPTSRGLLSSDHYKHDEKRHVLIGVEYEPNPENIHKIWFDESRDKYQAGYSYFNNTKPYSLSNDVKAKSALVYLSAEREIDRQMGYSSWTLLGRIIRQFDIQFPESYRDDLFARFNHVEELLRTESFNAFETELRNAFTGQVKRLDHQLELKFRAFDPLSYYRSLNLFLTRGISSEEVHLSEAGQGMRNFALLAMFRAYAKVFKGDGIIAIEEPEIYLHPHAQRSLSSLFQTLSSQGSQIFYSTHSGNFINAEHFEHICLVERRVDEEEDVCTQIKQVNGRELLATRQTLYPDKTMTIQSVKEKYRKNCSSKHAEAFFARKIVLVEGDTEENSLPIYASKLDYDFDAYGISIVNCRGKTSIDLFYHLYSSFGLPIYVIFDNDRRNSKPDDIRWNEILLTMLSQPVQQMPDGIVAKSYAILDSNFEDEFGSAIGTKYYSELKQDARTELGDIGKDLEAKYIAQRLVEQDIIPHFIEQIIVAIQKLGEEVNEEPPPNIGDIPF